MADPLSILFTQNPGKHVSIGQIQIDATINESHDYNLNVTSHPVEDGAFASDHVYEDPREVSITGEITATPVSIFTALGGISDRRVEAYDQLVALKSSRDFVTLVSGLKVFSDMVISGLNVVRDQRTGKRLQFTAKFKEIRKVSSQVIGVAAKAKPAVKDKVSEKKDLGRQETKAATAAQEAKSTSVLSGILGLGDTKTGTGFLGLEK